MRTTTSALLIRLGVKSDNGLLKLCHNLDNTPHQAATMPSATATTTTTSSPTTATTTSSTLGTLRYAFIHDEPLWIVFMCNMVMCHPKQELIMHSFKTIEGCVIPQPLAKRKQTALAELPILANVAPSLNPPPKPKMRLSKKKEKNKNVMAMLPSLETPDLTGHWISP